MATGIVTIGRRQYVSGLYWENSPSGRVTQAAKEAARQPGHQMAFFATRAGAKSGRVPQFGLCEETPGVKAGVPVLAACLANQQPGSWAGAFRLREGIAVVVVRDDLIVPDGDIFFLDEAEARDRLLQEMALGGLQRVYAPEPWGVSGADSMPIGLLLNERTEVRLRAVSMSAGGAALVGGALLVVALVLAVGWFLQQQSAREEAERAEQMQALERAKAEAQKMMPGFGQQKPEYPVPERKWEKAPNPMDVIKACKAALANMPLAVLGWRIEGVQCNSSSANIRWQHQPGYTKLPKGAVADDAGTSASLTIPFPSLAPRGDEQLRDPQDVLLRYFSQNWPGNISRMPDDPPPPPPPGYQGEWNPPPPPWIKRSFTVSVPVLPWTLPVFFDGLPGVVIDSINSGSGNLSGSWKIDGVIYENRP